MTKVYLHPAAKQVQPGTGIGQVIIAQNKYLPEWGIEIANSPDNADVVACHVAKGEMPRVDVLHCHGLYWSDVGGKYHSFHQRVNMSVVAAAREALAITVPSEWVAMPFKRDMRISPKVIGHGIDLARWKPGTPQGYVVWNKNRGQDVCDPLPAYELAKRGVEVYTTFAPEYPELPKTLRVLGLIEHEKMPGLLAGATAYLATTIETFGIGTIEAMACGVPVLGWNWGGTADIVKHLESGYLVDPGDFDGLLRGYEYIKAHFAGMSKAARRAAMRFTWDEIMPQYADLYQNLKAPKLDVAAVIPCYNYGRYVGGAIQSALDQNEPVKEIIVVDDGSTDNSVEIIQSFGDKVKLIQQKNQGVGNARNNGIAATDCDLIVCLDADDMIAPDFIRATKQAMAADRSLGVAYTALTMLFDNGDLGKTGFPPEFDWRAQTAGGVPPSNCIPSACMFRRSMWERAGGFKQQYHPAEDAEFWTRGLALGFTARRVSVAGLFIYRVHEGSASRTKKYMDISAWLPWMNDRKYPFAAPTNNPVEVRSYIAPAISVIIPVGKGHGKYLHTALESLVGQTLRAWEVIVVDDTDGEEIPLTAYPFARVIKTDGGKGAGAARNMGIDAAKGTLCMFLDADDWLANDALDAMVKKFMEMGGYKFIYGDWAQTTDGKTFEAGNAGEWNPAMAWTFPGNKPPVSILVETSVARQVRFDELLPGWEEWDFQARCATMGVQGARVGQTTLYYRLSTGMRRDQSHAKANEILDVLTRRYAPYLKGDKKIMSGCCGGGGDTVLEIKRKLGLIPPDKQPGGGVPGGEAPVRMEFIGEQKGVMTYTSPQTRKPYRGADNASNKFVDADPRDVEWLVSTGKFKVVVRNQATLPTPPKDVAPMVEVKKEPEKPKPTAAELQEQARRAIENAKLEAQAELEALENPPVIEESDTLTDAPGEEPELQSGIAEEEPAKEKTAKRRGRKARL